MAAAGRDGDGAGDGDGGTFGQTTSQTPRNWLDQEQEQELETENWTGLGRTGQDRTGQATARARFDRSSTHWPRNKRARVLAGLWILREVDPGEMEEGNAEIEGQAKTQKKSRASGWERGRRQRASSVSLGLYVSVCLCLAVCFACLPIDSAGLATGRDEG